MVALLFYIVLQFLGILYYIVCSIGVCFVSYCVVYWSVFLIKLCVPSVCVVYYHWSSVLYCVCHLLVFHCFLILRWRHPRRLGHLLTIGKIATVLYFSQWKTKNNAMCLLEILIGISTSPMVALPPWPGPAKVQRKRLTDLVPVYFCSKQVNELVS